jgi:hypothetical protein
MLSRCTLTSEKNMRRTKPEIGKSFYTWEEALGLENNNHAWVEFATNFSCDVVQDELGAWDGNPPEYVDFL